MSDLDVYWSKLETTGGSQQKLKPLIDMLMDKGLIKTQSHGSKLGDEMSIYLPNSVRNYLTNAMENNASRMKVEFMLIKNYCDKF